MRILIVEDETVAYENLKTIIAELDATAEIAGYTESVVQTVRWLTNNQAPDLIFMDIHLSDGSAFNIFSAITVETPVIFTTAYDEYAIDAFKVSCIDYLLKPIETEDVKRALEKFRRLTRQDILRYLAKLPSVASPGGYPEKLLIPVHNELIPIDVSRVAYFYTTQGSARVVLKDGKSYGYMRTLDSIGELLNPAAFFRANKQFIVAKSSVKNITIWFDNRLLITLDAEVPERIYVSKNKAALFKKWLTASEAQ
ncbi:MAG: LytTR family DNA-binding domain-containing protein [Prevotellaceae bacterium]|jgi:DNA-binding LytR/AlgR family response regulator|nr:LytTR family DNA-binding domain-containing protein [Prevotellaceae bacterium]